MFFLVASWKFSIAEMGLYAFAISAQWLIVGLVGTGPGVAIVRLSVEQLSSGNRSQAAGIAIMASATAVALCLGIGLAAALGVEWLHVATFSATAAVLVAAWAAGRSVLECLRSSLLAQERYRRAAILTVSGAVAGLAALAGVVATGSLTIERILLAHAIGQITSAVLAVGLLTPLW
ncbi:MAG: hypothetical protein HKN13_08010, partial [Rhodothermales bacterium]|nr:hypothetical protein [Rhodothermales bacterium]